MDFEREDQIISEFLRSVGPWSDHIVIGGGYALIIYTLYFNSIHVENPPVGTRDLDSLISRRIPTVSKKNIRTYLFEAGFSHYFKDRNNPATESYFKEVNGIEIEVEFLTDDARRHNRGENISISGVVAQSLSYLENSLQNSLEFQTHSQEKGKVVMPSAWVFHKGLTFTRRKNRAKLFKDLYGIWYAATQFKAFSESFQRELEMYSINSPKWFRTFQTNLNDWIDNATPLDWNHLESQDPYGRLRRKHFEKAIKNLTNIHATWVV